MRKLSIVYERLVFRIVGRFTLCSRFIEPNDVTANQDWDAGTTRPELNTIADARDTGDERASTPGGSNGGAAKRCIFWSYNGAPWYFTERNTSVAVVFTETKKRFRVSIVWPFFCVKYEIFIRWNASVCLMCIHMRTYRLGKFSNAHFVETFVLFSFFLLFSF